MIVEIYGRAYESSSTFTSKGRSIDIVLAPRIGTGAFRKVTWKHSLLSVPLSYRFALALVSWRRAIFGTPAWNMNETNLFNEATCRLPTAPLPKYSQLSDSGSENHMPGYSSFVAPRRPLSGPWPTGAMAT